MLNLKSLEMIFRTHAETQFHLGRIAPVGSLQVLGRKRGGRFKIQFHTRRHAQASLHGSMKTRSIVGRAVLLGAYCHLGTQQTRELHQFVVGRLARNGTLQVHHVVGTKGCERLAAQVGRRHEGVAQSHLDAAQRAEPMAVTDVGGKSETATDASSVAHVACIDTRSGTQEDVISAGWSLVEVLVAGAALHVVLHTQLHLGLQTMRTEALVARGELIAQLCLAQQVDVR